MKIVFFGTPEYVIPILKELKKHHEILGVVTQEPKPAGRDKRIKRSEVDWWAYKRKIPIFFDPHDAPGADFAVLAAYGKIIPGSVLKKYTWGILNVHPSLLPKFRGASPIQGAILSGEKETGVTIIKLDEKLDHGPIVSFFKEKIDPADTTQTLRDRLFVRAAKFLTALIPSYISGKINLKKQDEKTATYTKILNKQAGFVESEDLINSLEGRGAKKIYAFIRALTPWPGAWTRAELGKRLLRLKILEAGVKNRKLTLERVQLEGKNPVSWEEFVKGYPQARFSGKKASSGI